MIGVDLNAISARASAVPVRSMEGIAAVDFNQLVQTHQRRVYRVLLSLLRDPDAADTLTQECFLRAYERRAQFRGESPVQAWLLRIAVNLARDYHRTLARPAFSPAMFFVAWPQRPPPPGSCVGFSPIPTDRLEQDRF